MKVMKRMLRALLLLLAGLAAGSAWAEGGEHGLSLDGELKYPKGFKGFDYTSARAKAGGTLTLHSRGGFDKMNPFTLKGSAPDYLSSLVFESLTVQSLDEPFSQYGLLAESMQIANDGLSITYTLHPDARFSDGAPVTAADVKFSFDTLKSEKAHPLYRSYWKDITRAEVQDDRQVTFHFAQKNREVAMIAGEMPVFSRAFYEKHPFDEGGLTPPIASGPYMVEKVVPGKTMVYKRNPDYWGWKRPVQRGMYNFERVMVKYFKDPVVALEAFKAGDYDFKFENNSKMWARDYLGEKFDSGQIVKETLDHKNGAGMQGFVFNLRRPLFQDKRVRQALELAFDFEWSNKNLFYGQYARSYSYFTNSEMAATGTPSKEELALLEPFRDQLDPDVFKTVYIPPKTTKPDSLRGNLRKAMRLLKQAGWTMGPDRVLVNAGGEQFRFDVMLVSPAFERIMAPYAKNLKKLGVLAEYRTVDLSLYQRRMESFDFDMVISVYGQSQSPGNEQRNMWSAQAAETNGSRNYMGLKDPVVDALVEKIIYADDRKELITACKALDRVLLAGHYIVPNWHAPNHRIAWWNKFDRPETLPLYYQPGSWLWAWWLK